MNLRPVQMLHSYLQYIQYNIHPAMMHYKLKQLLPLIKGRWLDIGAGDQPYKKHFAGADEYLTTNTKQHYKPQELEQIEKHTTYWIEDGKTLPVSDQSFDGVACFQVLSLIEKPEDFFREINRVLKPGGKLILTTDFLYPQWNKFDRNRLTSFSLEQLCEMTDFEVLTIESFGGFASTMYKLFNRWTLTYPEMWKTNITFAKILAVIPYLVLLILQPIINLEGRLIFEIEKRNRNTTDFTFNLLLVATKK
jgi:SAM-dependent methyltransferase